MSRDLPPLSALRVFEAAARCLSFTRAAIELGMTQAAVSYQIKLLEDRIGSPLFLRGRRPLALTHVGAALASPASEALDLLASGYMAARGNVVGTLTLDVVPSFAVCWLARHLGDFQRQYPDLAIRIISTPTMGDFNRDNLDLAIRWGTESWPKLSCHPLFNVAFTPMLNTQLMERIGGFTTPADLAWVPLVDPTDPWWDVWFKGIGVERPTEASRTATGLKAQHLGAAAAMAGHGVALLTPLFWHEEVISGRLVQPFEFISQDGSAFWLCYPADRRNLLKVRLFRDWLISHFCKPADDRRGRTPAA